LAIQRPFWLLKAGHVIIMPLRFYLVALVFLVSVLMSGLFLRDCLVSRLKSAHPPTTQTSLPHPSPSDSVAFQYYTAGAQGRGDVFSTPEGNLYLPPSFFLIGCTKCGTTSMFSYLIRHPEIASTCKHGPLHSTYSANPEHYLKKHAPFEGTLAGKLCHPSSGTYVLKEPKFWRSSIQTENQFESYVLRHSPHLPAYMNFTPTVGDFSACTFFGCGDGDPAQVAKNIVSSFAPRNVKFIMLVCDPARRALSYLRMICAEGATGKEKRRQSLVYCDDSPEVKFSTALNYLVDMNCSHTIYGTAEWQQRRCLTKRYHGIGNSIVRGYYGDWLKIWLTATASRNIGVVQLEVLQDHGQVVLSDMHQFIGVQPYTYPKGTFDERYNIAKSTRAHLNVTGRFVGTSQVRVDQAEEITITEVRTEVFAKPISEFCRIISEVDMTTLGRISLCLNT